MNINNMTTEDIISAAYNTVADIENQLSDYMYPNYHDDNIEDHPDSELVEILNRFELLLCDIRIAMNKSHIDFLSGCVGTTEFEVLEVE